MSDQEAASSSEETKGPKLEVHINMSSLVSLILAHRNKYRAELDQVMRCGSSEAPSSLVIAARLNALRALVEDLGLGDVWGE